ALLSEDLLNYYRRIVSSPLTVVDVETTGSRPFPARVIEIAVVQGSLETGISVETSFLINAQVAVPRTITRLTGITTEMVEQGQPAETVWRQLKSHLCQGVLTGHNLAFDYGFIQAEYRQLDQTFTRPESHRFCTVLLSRLLLADLPSRSLPQLVKHFRFDVGPSHRALADTKACWLLANLLLKRLQEMDDDTLLQQFRRQWVPLREAAKIFNLTRRELQDELDARHCERRTSRRSNRHLYLRGDVEALYRELYPLQLSLGL
ncbi:MAG: exonuclease domain-containing protein, partial [Leptolyngbya sp.]|nr:exonuclease domain-containing protein [Leptolyngbya sp.]